ncbi:putative endonuclease lcl3 [Linderina macrospora]|uniref:Endonuclease lcl3 n=1 Tax=Linderina macrospora TaxID=4868 RepID=A0ACC1JDS8_9FUNG|nr:putative endonuclease lcl3 [Linderina macrospora]
MRSTSDNTPDTYADRFTRYAKHGLYLSLTIGVTYGLYRMFRRYQTSADIPERVIKSHEPIHGIVIDVSDGDTLRLYHTPALQWFSPPPEKKRGMSKWSISVRISAVDAPEVSHFGKPAQPLSAEAKDYLASQVLGKRVTVVPLAKDQYGRVVGSVYYRSMFVFKYDASHEMLKAGLAVLYRGGNAQYNGEKELLERIEEEAKQAKRGVWGLKKGKFETPAAYKAKHK